MANAFARSSYTGLDIANFFIQLACDLQDNSMDNLKVNKMVYYAQAWSVIRNNRTLFDEEIQAWDYGPVVPSVYRTYKSCGRNPIAEPQETFDERRLSSEDLELLIDVYRAYGKYTGKTLIDMTHAPNEPWTRVYQFGKNSPISIDLIRECFANRKLDSFNVDAVDLPIITEVPTSWDSKEDAVYG